MAKKTVTRVVQNPDGTTEITTRRVGSGCIGWFLWVFAVAFVVTAPATWLHLWSIPVYIVMAAILILGLLAKVKQDKEGKAQTGATPNHSQAAAPELRDPDTTYTSPIDELTKAKALHDQGVISGVQFETLKVELLKQISEEETRRIEEKRQSDDASVHQRQAAAQVAARKQEKAQLRLTNRHARWAKVGLTEERRERWGIADSPVGPAIKSPVGPSARRERRERKAAGKAAANPQPSSDSISASARGPAERTPPAGWYPDPSGNGQLRWWNGAIWTDHTTRPLPPVDPQ
jgi:Protein of unknown function (DUF2510)